MLKFMLASRSKPEHTKERYYFEWGIIHVALMLTTPTVMSTFRRYAQHFVPDGLEGARLLFPLSKMAWENMADHWLETWEDLVLPFKADDYPNRMQPHNFGDSNFDIQLMTGEELYAEDGYYSGGIKLVHFLHRRPDVSLDEFKAKYRAHGDVLVESGRGLLRKYVQNTETQGDPAYFKGTLFELGGVNTYAGVEELWFDDVGRRVRVLRRPGAAGRPARELCGVRRRRRLLDGHDRAGRLRLRDARPHQPAAGGPQRRARSRRSSTRRATRAGGCPAGRSGRARRPSRDVRTPAARTLASAHGAAGGASLGADRRRVRRGAPGLRGAADRRHRDDAGPGPVPAGPLHDERRAGRPADLGVRAGRRARRHPDGPRLVAVGRQDAVRRRGPLPGRKPAARRGGHLPVDAGGPVRPGHGRRRRDPCRDGADLAVRHACLAAPGVRAARRRHRGGHRPHAADPAQRGEGRRLSRRCASRPRSSGSGCSSPWLHSARCARARRRWRPGTARAGARARARGEERHRPARLLS